MRDLFYLTPNNMVSYPMYFPVPKSWIEISLLSVNTVICNSALLPKEGKEA